MFHGTLLFVNDFEELAVEFIDDLVIDEELYVTADGVTESISPGPGGAYTDRLTARI
jgi:hypothetical protein